MKVGTKIEDLEFKAYTMGEFVTGRMSDFSGKWVVLFFYPLGRVSNPRPEKRFASCVETTLRKAHKNDF